VLSSRAVTALASCPSSPRPWPSLGLALAATLALLACDNAPRRPGGSGGGGGGVITRDAAAGEDAVADGGASLADGGALDADDTPADLGPRPDADGTRDAEPRPDAPARFDAQPAPDAFAPDAFAPDAFVAPDATPAFDAGPVGPGACTNSADLSIVTSQGEAGLTQIAVSCVLQGGCFPAPTTTCIAPCVETATGLSGACSTCVAERVTCAFAACASQCLLSPSSQACADCQATSGCSAQFETCSGLAPP
jgi:hypothetical protein